MGILSSAFEVLEKEVYAKIPDVRCSTCGECCVSPHMTLVEFCHMMAYLTDRPDILVQTLSRAVPYHPAYPGYLTCRFQTVEKLCSIHPNRALACRLHGHPVLKKVGLKYQVHCQKIKAAPDRDFTPEEVYALMDRITDLNQGYYSYYAPPYWISGLNTESWLTILFTDIPQPPFRLLKKIMLRELGLQNLSHCFTQTVLLSEKLALIDQFQSQLAGGALDYLCPLLKRIQNDFPDTGAYYYYEAEMYLNELQKKKVSQGPSGAGSISR